MRKFIFPTIIGCIFGFLTSMFVPYLSPYLRDSGVSYVYVTLMFAVFPLTTILFSPVIGAIADNIGRKKMILFGMGMQILALLIYLTFAHPMLIMLARFLDAIAVISVTLMAIAKVNDLLQDKIRGKYQGIFLSIVSVGNIFGPITGAWLIDKLFIKAPFIASLSISIAVFIMLFFWKSHHQASIKRCDLNYFEKLRQFLRVKKLRAMAIIGIVMQAKMSAIYVFLPLFIIDELNGSYRDIGIIFLCFAALDFLQFWYGMWADRIGRIRLALIGVLISAGAFIFISQVTRVSSLIIIALVFSIGSSIFNVTAWTLMSDIGEALKKEGMVIGAYNSLSKTGSFLSFLLSGLFVSAFGAAAIGIRMLFILNGLLVIVGVLLSLKWFMAKQEIDGVRV